MAHAAIAFEHNFHPSATKIMDLETVFLSVIPDHRKSRKCAQSWSQEAPQIHPQIDKNGNLGFSAFSGCPPGPQDHQNDVPGKKSARSPTLYVFVEKSDPRATKRHQNMN